MSGLSFSVVINTYNRAELLANAIASLLRLRHKQYEIIVVNGPSTDNTAEVLSEFRQHLKIADCPEANLSRSRNIGIAAAAGDIVAFIDDDATAEPNWLCELEPGYDDPKVAAVGGFTRDSTGYGFQWKYMICDWLGQGRTFDSPEQAGLDGHLAPDGFLYPSGVNSSFRRSALLEVGGFDEIYVIMCDESDVVARLIERGYTVRCLPSAQVHHRYAASHLRSHEHVPKSLFATARSRGYFAARHAIPRLPLNEVLAGSSEWLSEQVDWVLNLAAYGKIGAEDASRLCRELHDGLCEGFHEGLTEPKRRLRSRAELDQGGVLKLISKRRAKRTLRICFVSEEYPPEQAGEIGVWTLATAQGLAAAGHEVSVVTTADAHTRVDFEHGVWVHRIERRRFPGRRGPDMPDVHPRLRDHLLAVRDEVLRIHAVRGLDLVCAPLGNVEGMALIATGELPVVLSLHAPMQAVVAHQPEWQDGEADSHLLAAERWCLQHADFVLANSRRLVARMERLYDIAIDRTRVSVVPRALPNLPDLSAPPETLRRQATDIVALFIGWQESEDAILQAIAPLLERFPRLRCVLADEERPARGDDENFAEAFDDRHADAAGLDRVDFRGFVSEAAREELYRGCDIVVLPPQLEFFGLHYIEAMKFGKPIVAGRSGVAAEIVEDGITGLLVTSDDPAALTLAIEELVVSPDRREAMGAAARQSFRRRFALEPMIANIEEVFFSLGADTTGRGKPGRMQVLDPNRPVGLESGKTYAS